MIHTEQIIERAADMIARRGLSPEGATKKLVREGVDPWTAFLCAKAGRILARDRPSRPRRPPV